MKYIFSSVLIFLLLPSLSSGQSSPSHTISGVIKAAESGETLIGASIGVASLKKGTYTNDYGFYSLTLPESTDSIEIRFFFAGYRTEPRTILLNQNIQLDIELTIASLDEVVIEANSIEEQLNSTQMSVERISMEEAKRLPALFGEVDIIKTLQLKPGVSSGSEGSSGIFVRGGGPDQNLVLLDNTVVYNPSHLFGFFSTFNSDAVKDVKLYKGGFPGQYGGRLSSVIDVKMNEGNKKKFSGAGGVGLIASRLTLEGPIVKDKASFMVSGRRTYVDIITRQINKLQEDNPDFNPIPDYFFYDFNAKVNYELSDKDQLFLSGYFGRDKFTFKDDDFDFNFNWGNSNATLRWNHLFSPKLFLNTSASYSDYEYIISNNFDIFSFELGSRITDGTFRTDFTWIPDNKHTVRFGASGIYHRFIVGRLNAGASDESFSLEAGQTYFGGEYGLYIGDDFEVNNRVKLNAGLRLSGFSSDSTFYAGVEPRFSARITLSENVSVKASYARMIQYLHLVSNSGASLPTDIWYPSNRRVPPQGSHQVVAGINISIGEQYILSNEIYYKWLENQIDFRDAANLFVNDDLDSEFVFGKGWAYGNEIYIEKTKGRLTGWIGYTLAWSFRQFQGVNPNGEVRNEDAINDGEPIFPRNDKRHDVSVVALYDLSKRWSISASWEYRSGNATTLPIGRFFSFGPEFLNLGNASATDQDANFFTLIPDFVKRNSFRMPAYHKLDIGVVFKFFPKWGESDLTLSVYNAYNRRNPYFLYIEPQTNDQGVPIDNVAKQVALFPVIPSITYNFKF
ncbi:MAG: TonB-dependent receptor [Bacteroidota bacterium]